ncbi:MAG: extracellular solute-binding protein [Deltaproteobacteria bacterium]|nr:extracellular solute-binding protein [Deltaproteobacteria bacterium]
MVWYTVLSESVELARQFERKYPFIKVDVLRASNPRILNRITTEVQSGKYNYDVVRTRDYVMHHLVQSGLVQPYESAERNAYEPGWRDEKGFWTSTDDNYYVFGYNTRLVSRAEAPKTWEDLLDPRWKGKIGLDGQDFELYLGLRKKWSEEKAQAFLKRLAKQDVQFYAGHTLLAQLVAAGELPLAWVFAHRAESMKSKGAPIEWVSNMDPIIVTLGPIGLGARPQHPNAAKLLIDYVLSREGQQLIQSFDRIPSRSDIKPRTAKLNRKQLPLLPLDPEVGGEIKTHMNRFRSFFGLQQ